MPIVTIKLFSGRSKEVKKKIAQEITDSLVKNLQIPPEAVIIIFEDVEKHDFAQGGVIAEESS
uniref:4-oxalocrotonate tautomerase n=1 Tax=Caldimicrobium thiodismutans TaxID=1653476 RepID=A0A832LV32_9BACT